MLALGVAAIGTVVGLALWERRENPALDVREREPAATAERAERALQAERVRGALARLARDRPPAEPPALPAMPPGAAEKPAPDPDPAVAPARPAPPSSAVYMAHLGNAFAEETIDPAWSRRAAEVVATRLAAAGDRSLQSIECHTSMCRLVIEETDVERSGQLIRAVLGGPGDEVWSGASFSRAEQGADGRTERVTYLFRTGTALPSS